MNKTCIKVTYKGDMKMLPLEGKEFDKLILSIKTSFSIKGDIALTPLNAPKSEPIASIEQVLELVKKGSTKFIVADAVAATVSVQPPSSKKPEEEEEKKEVKKEVATASKGTSVYQPKEVVVQPQALFKLNPAVLGQMFKKLLTSDSSVVAIMDFIRENKRNMMNGNYELKDYVDTLKGMENTMGEALDKNIFLMDFESLSGESDKENKDVIKKEEKASDSNSKSSEKKHSAFEGMEIEKSICDA